MNSDSPVDTNHPVQEKPSSIGLYIHIPFCQRLCSYCDFAVHIAPEKDWEPYFQVLIRDLEQCSEGLNNRTIHSIFFGGGTPSLVGSQRIERLLQTVRNHFTLEPHLEITLEANPESLTFEELLHYRRSGINRLSIGVQSFHSLHLQRLNRLHTEVEVEQSVGWARQVGFKNISLDFIYGQSEQTLRQWQEDLKKP